MAMSHHVLIPQELVDNIVDHLHDDLTTLKTSALVNSAWLIASRYHVFRRISIRLFEYARWDDTPPEGLIDTPHRIILSSTGIVPYIRELVFISNETQLKKFFSRGVSSSYPM